MELSYSYLSMFNAVVIASHIFLRSFSLKCALPSSTDLPRALSLTHIHPHNVWDVAIQNKKQH